MKPIILVALLCFFICCNRQVDKKKIDDTKKITTHNQYNKKAFNDKIKEIYIGKEFFSGDELINYEWVKSQSVKEIDSLSYSVYKSISANNYIFSLDKFLKNEEAKQKPINEGVNSKNIEAIINKEIKHYKTEPIYSISVLTEYCFIDVLVNDFPVLNDYNPTDSYRSNSSNINFAISKSGRQKLTYRLYPIGESFKKKHHYGNILDTLTDSTSVNIKIRRSIFRRGNILLEDNIVFQEHKSINDQKGKFAGKNKTYYEYSFEFDAEVQYELESWTKGQDLKNLDQKLLKKKILEYYENQKKLYESNNLDLYAKNIFNFMRRDCISMFKNEAQVYDQWEEFKNIFNHKNKKINTLKNYKITFFGEGKIVTLQNQSLEYPLRGNGAFSFNFDDEKNEESICIPSIYLYLPQGKKLEDGLQMIE